MSLNFRLSYNEGFDYVDLFPKTNIESIEENNDILKYSELLVTVPVTTEVNQSISLDLTSNQQKAPFYIQLVNVNENTMSDYSTINQAQIVNNNLILTRLNDYPKNEIQIKLIFKEAGI